MDAVQSNAGAWLMDEILQTPVPLFNAGASRATYAREHKYKLNIADYARPREIYGRISFLAVGGDHLQLPPVPKTTSLLAPTEGASDEQKLGAAMFRNLEYLFEMHTMMRFNDPVLVSILLKMRTPGGAALAADEWTKLLDTALDASQLERSPGNQVDDMWDWYEACYLWSVVSMAAFTRARASARHHKQRLYYCQAADEIQGAGVSKEFDGLFDRALQVPNLSTTAKLPAFAMFHVGMRGRITSPVLPPWAVQDCTGEVMEIEVADVDMRSLRQEQESAGDDERLAAEYCLKTFPKGIYFKLDGCSIEFLPPRICEAHRAAGYSENCDQCKRFPGWVYIRPITKKWYHKDEVLNATLPVDRTQLPLVPEKACSLYTLQGATTDPGLIAHLDMPNRADDDMKWLIIYVMLSRVRSLDCLKTTGMSTEKAQTLF